MLRILFLVPGHDVGGAEIATGQIVKWAESEHWVSVAAGRSDVLDQLFETQRSAVIAVDPTTKWRAPIGVAQLVRICRRYGIDVVHANHRWPVMLGVAAGRVTGVPTVFHVQSLIEPRWPTAWGAATIAVSRAVADHLVDLGADPGRIHVVYNGAELRVPTPGEVAAVREEVGPLLRTRVVAIYVGRLVEGKGLATLLDALVLSPEVGLLVVGDGPLRGPLEERAKSGEFQGRVFFTGWVDDPAPYRDVADVVVLPSDSYPEGLPLALIEAMAQRCVVVATAVSGVPEVIEDGRSGLLVTPGDPRELAAALSRLAGDGPLREAMAARAAERAEHFSVARMARGVLDVLDEVVNG